MKAYKGTKKGKCRNLTYEVGKTYELAEGKLKMCEIGFHFCKNFDDVNVHYPFKDNSTIVYEVEILGKVIDSNEKSVTDKMKIIREIPRSELNSLSNKIEFDRKGNLIKYVSSNGYWEKCEYDENGNQIRWENSKGYWETWKYDKKRNQIRFENLFGKVEEIKIT